MQLLGLEVPPDIKAKYTPEAHALLEPEYTSRCNTVHNHPVNVTSIRVNKAEENIFNNPPGHHESDDRGDQKSKAIYFFCSTNLGIYIYSAAQFWPKHIFPAQFYIFPAGIGLN